MEIWVDYTCGFDVMRGNKVLRNFPTYEEAWAYASERGGRYVRYWVVKNERES